MKRIVSVLAVVAVTVLGSATTAFAEPNVGGGTTDHGATITGHDHHESSTPGHYTPGHVYTPTSGPPPPRYADYYTPACSVNGPPGEGSNDAMCMGAATICKNGGRGGGIFMQHWRQQLTPTKGQWEFVGNECRGGDQPTEVKPTITVEDVLDVAYAEAPKPTAIVQPGNKSYVNLPNNYFAEAPSQTVPVVVLGETIPVTFTVTDVTWDFGDGGTATGEGIKDAGLHQDGAVEHEYASQGSYDITAKSEMTVSFTIPGGGAQQLPGALEIASATQTLPVGEIQTRVDQTG